MKVAENIKLTPGRKNPQTQTIIPKEEIKQTYSWLTVGQNAEGGWGWHATPQTMPDPDLISQPIITSSETAPDPTPGAAVCSVAFKNPRFKPPKTVA
jgi:hypothetical protein